MSDAADPLMLVADIGGTNTRVALAQGRTVLGHTVRRYANAEHPSLEAALRRFIAEEGDVRVAAACVAVAGPVKDGRGTLTNLDWTIDTATLARATGAEATAILNDLQAQGHALGFLDPSKTTTIIPIEADAAATKLVVNLGTGFNIAQVFDTGHGRLVPPAEAGHGTLPVRNEQDLRMAHFVGAAHGFASVEEVLSGRGIVQVYDWLGHEEGDPARASSAEIMSAIARGGDNRSVRAGGIFVRVLATVCGDLALATLPFGGIWLVGGLARAFAPHLRDLGFIEAFRDKGRFSTFLENFGVVVVEDDNAALTGSAAHLMALLRPGH